MADNKFWVAQLIRLTLFPSEVIEKDGFIGWWKDVTGIEPENVNIQTRIGMITVSGVIESDRYRLDLQLRSNRVDWILQPAIKEDFDFTSLPHLGDLNEATTFFNALMLQWMMSVKLRISRVAFATKLIGSVEDKISGYKKLSHFLPDIKIDHENSTDFSYTINHPKKIVCEGKELEINRLSRWSCVEGTLISASIENSELIPQKNNIKHNMCILELDINTIPKPEYSIELIDSKPIIDSLSQESIQISYKGYH